MKPEEMPVELLTEPITHFGLYADMLPFSVIPESEWIIVDMSIQRPTIVQSYFRSQRRCGGSPTEEITLYRYDPDLAPVPVDPPHDKTERPAAHGLRDVPFPGATRL